MKEMRDAKKILNDTRKEALYIIEKPGVSLEAKVAWYYTHIGEIEMAYFLGLIDEKELGERKREWSEHRPEEW